MKKVQIVCAGILLLWTAGGTAMLLKDRLGADRTLEEPALKDLEKLFQLAQKFHAELEAVAGQANPPGEDDKRSIREAVRASAFQFEVTRFYYSEALRTRQVTHVASAVLLMKSVVDTPFAFRTYKVGQGYQDMVGTAKLQAFEDEFHVLALRFMKDNL